MSEMQLERSVLEAKERDELFAIADALGAKPGARAKKADLITEILRATGVESEAAAGNSQRSPDKPKRTRTAKKPAEESSEAAHEAAERSDRSDRQQGEPATTSADAAEEPGPSRPRPNHQRDSEPDTRAAAFRT